MEEMWKRIEGYEQYEVSNLGRIKSFKQNSTKGEISLGNRDKKGYLTKTLYSGDGSKKTFKVHRLVAEAFLPNPDDLPQVNHKDENKTNNEIHNLEWCDAKYNLSYGTRTDRARKTNMCCSSTSKKVFSVDKDGAVERFNSIGSAERATGLSHSNIVRALKERALTCGGRKWYYIK